MARRHRTVLAAAAFLYMSGLLCEALLGWWPHAMAWAAWLALSAWLVYALALVLSKHLA